MANTVKFEIESDTCAAATVIVKMGDDYGYVEIEGISFEADAWPELKAEIDRMLALANRAVNAPKEQS